MSSSEVPTVALAPLSASVDHYVRGRGWLYNKRSSKKVHLSSRQFERPVIAHCYPAARKAFCLKKARDQAARAW